MKELFKQFIKYFNSCTEKQKKQDWEELKEYNNCGPIIKLEENNMIITKEEYEVYDKVKHCINKRTEEIFHLLKDISLSCFEYYEGCTIDGDLEFRIGGNYRGEYDYTLFQRPLEYLFMTDEEIIKAEEEREKEIKKAEELKEKEFQKEIQKKELEELKRLKEKYES